MRLYPPEALWPSELPLGFLLFWIKERETWSISARSMPEVVGTKSALCYAKQSGVLPLALRLGENGDWEIANIYVAGPCPVTNWHRHRAITRATRRMAGSLADAFRHVSFWRRDKK